MTMKGARDDDDGCWEKGKPVTDDLSEPVRSNTGICLSFLRTTSFAFFLRFFCRPLSVLLWRKRNGERCFSKSGRGGGPSPHALRVAKVKDVLVLVTTHDSLRWLYARHRL
jgi:hypothetical protein